jgi:hypothetical protein
MKFGARVSRQRAQASQIICLNAQELVMNLRSITDIVVDLLNESTILVRTQSQLARAELSENLTRIAVGIGLLVGGAILLIPALVILLQAGVAAVETQGIASHWSALIVGGAALLIGLILFAIGISQIKPRTLVPHKTIHQLRRDLGLPRNQVRTEDDRVQRTA